MSKNAKTPPDHATSDGKRLDDSDARMLELIGHMLDHAIASTDHMHKVMSETSRYVRSNER